MSWGGNRAASSYSGLLKQVPDFSVVVVVFLLFQGLTESYSKQFWAYPEQLSLPKCEGGEKSFSPQPFECIGSRVIRRPLPSARSWPLGTAGTSLRAASHNDRLCALPARRAHGRVPRQEQVAAQLQPWGGGGGTHPAVFQQNGQRSHQAAWAPQEKVSEQRRQLPLAK